MLATSGLVSYGSGSVRGCPAYPFFRLDLGRCSEMVVRECSLAVAAADHRRRDGLTRTDRVCEPVKDSVVCGHHSRRRPRSQSRRAWRLSESRRMVWVAARHADHPSAAGAVRHKVKGDRDGYAMASLPMLAMHVWSEPSHVVAVACFPECSRALTSRCLAGCRSIQTTTASNYYIQLLALAPKARP